MFCMECGEKLPDHAKFCFKCGAKVDTAAEGASQSGGSASKKRSLDLSSLENLAAERRAAKKHAAKDETHEKPAPHAAHTAHAAHAAPPPAGRDAEDADAHELEERFASLDPVVCHSEYYYLRSGNPMLGGFSMAVNGKYILRHVTHFPNDDYILSDENGENERRLDIRIKLHKAEYKYLMGFNSSGVWFMVGSQINDRILNVKFLCVDVVGGRTIEYPIAHPHGTISDVYVYEDEVCYINNSADGIQYLHRLTPNNGDDQLFETQKEETIFRLSADANRIAWGFTSKRDVKTFCRWHFYDRETKKASQVAVPPDRERTWLPLAEIGAVDLAKNVMYTSLNAKEAVRFGAQEWSIAVRKIKDPELYGILNYKDNQSAVWKVDRRLTDYYFDGAVFLTVPDPTEIDRFDRFGNKHILGKTGSGACQNFLVTDKWLFVNYDAHDMVRLPKLFTANRGQASDNPEAFFVFGKDQNFRM